MAVLAEVINADKIRYIRVVFEGIKSKNVLLIYAVIGFGSIALVALGELSGAEPGSFLYDSFLKLVFGERSSRMTTFIIVVAVLFYWIYAFADLMRATEFRFF